MQLHLPDPAYIASERARANFRLALTAASCVVAVLWVLALLDWGLALGLSSFGVRPRTLAGLPGVLFAPLLHGSFSHLISNSLPLLVLGTGMLYLYPHSALKVIPAVYLGPGLAVWLFGRPGIHIGASGLVYGLAIYVLIAGLIRRDTRAVSASMLVFFLYGTLVWGMVPTTANISWQTHLVAALIGLILAVLCRRSDIPPRKRYVWENENNDFPDS